MNKCGKSFMPECEYFTTGGCVSPFNCPYKCEQESITTATSTPLNPNVIYTTETNKDAEIARLTAENERLSKQLTDRKCVYLFDNETAEGCVLSPCPNYKTVEDILKENAELTARLEKAVEMPCKVGDKVYWIEDDDKIYEYEVQGFNMGTTQATLRVVIDGIYFCPVVEVYKDTRLFFDRAKAEARLAELKGGDEK